MVKIIVDNIYSKIVGIIPDTIQKDLNDTLSYKIANARHMPQVKNGHWDGVIRLYFKHKGQSFHTGLLSLVREIFKKHNVDFEILDKREKPEQNYPELKFVTPVDFEERDYQTFTIDRAVKFTRGILSVATGGGKTLIATRLISELKTYPFMFYVLTKDLMDQAYGVLSSCLSVPIGRIGDGMVDIQKINVCTIQTAIRILNAKNDKFKISDYKFDDEDEWDEKFIENQDDIEKVRKLIAITKGIFLDESHHASSRTTKEVLEASPYAYWKYGGTATPVREDGADIMLQALFGTKIVDINASYLIKRGDLVKPFIFMEPIDSKVNLHSYQKIYEACVVKNEKFNKHVAETVNYLVGKKLSVLVLVQQYKQGEYLKTLIPNSEFITGKVSSEKRKQYLNDLREGKITLIGTSLADEGIDVKGLDVVVMAGGGKSVTRISQRIGRCLRKDKKAVKQKDRAIVIIYEHNAKYLDKHAKKVRAILKKEPEFEVISSNGPDFIYDEIDRVLGVDSDRNNVFK